jgi:cyclic lactone autoinducer peptide
MKRFFDQLGKILAAIALAVAMINVNSTCCFHLYQAKVPDKAKQLSRFK